MKQALENNGSDAFFEAVTELLNEHQQTAPPTGKIWEILMLPSEYNLEAVWEAAEESTPASSLD